jgi:hypothetical protein
LSDGPCLAALAAIAGAKSESVHNADEIMDEIVAKRLVEHLERAGFVAMKEATGYRRGCGGAGI